jgi:amidophosphoribosyltransferase
LIAHEHSVEEIRDQIGADSLGYLSIEGLRISAAKELKRGICDACFSDEYPIEIDPAQAIPQLSLFRAVKEEDVGH